MKKMLLIFIPVSILIFGLVFSQGSLSNLFNLNSTASGKALDLGFITQEFNTKGDVITYTNNGKVVGECVTLRVPKHKLNSICDKLGLIITDKYVVEDILIIEGSSARIKYAIEGRLANVQISAKENEIIIGTPIIYGSY